MSRRWYCHWDSHAEDVPFLSENDLGSHIQNHFSGPEDEGAVACHWDACHELIDIDKIMDHFRTYHQRNAYHPHGSDVCEFRQLSPEASSASLSACADPSVLQNPVQSCVATHLPVPPCNKAPEAYVRVHGGEAPPLNLTDTPSLAQLPPAPNVSRGPGGDAQNDADQPQTCQWLSNGGVCGRQFANSRELNQHLVEDHVGGGQSSYACMWAGCPRHQRQFSQRQKIVRHLQVHARNCSHKCPTCGRMFSDESLLRIHRQTHSGERPFACQLCSKSFRTAKALTIHTRSHTGEKPLACKYPGCGKRFADTSNLTKHMRTHMDKRFECPECHRMFTRRDQLLRHTRIHAPPTPQDGTLHQGSPGYPMTPPLLPVHMSHMQPMPPQATLPQDQIGHRMSDVMAQPLSPHASQNGSQQPSPHGDVDQHFDTRIDQQMNRLWA